MSNNFLKLFDGYPLKQNVFASKQKSDEISDKKMAFKNLSKTGKKLWKQID
jgi:hypothetical protein